MEFDCFIKGFHLLSAIMPEDQLFHEPNEKANEEAEADVSATWLDNCNRKVISVTATWLSLETLKLASNFSSDVQGSHPDNLSVSMPEHFNWLYVNYI